MNLLFTLSGIALILAVAADVFRTLFASAGKRAVGQVLARVFWRGLPRYGFFMTPSESISGLRGRFGARHQEFYPKGWVRL